MDTGTATRSISCRRRAAMLAAGTAVAGGMLAMPGAAFAQGGTETYTTKFRDVTKVVGNTDPCTGIRETVTLTQSGVFHLTLHADGHFSAGGTVTGELTATPVDPAWPTYTGRFTVRFSQRDNGASDTAQFTNSIRTVGSDGSVRIFHGVTHITAASIDFSTEDGQPVGVKVAFEKFSCR